MMLVPGVSEMSFGLQVDAILSGELTGPSKTDGEKHSLIVATSLEDFCQEYLKVSKPEVNG